MLPRTLPFSVRRFACDLSESRELEHQPRQVFRSAGVRFFEIGALLGGLAYFAFFDRRHPVEPMQRSDSPAYWGSDVRRLSSLRLPSQGVQD